MPQVRRKHTEHLKYVFSEPELKQIGLDLAKENQEVETINKEKAQIVAGLKARLTVAESHISKLAGNLREGCDYRSVECGTVYHFPRAGKKTIVRMDTGEELRVLDMEEHERQEPLLIDGTPIIDVEAERPSA